jgi:PKD repeat protein
MKKNTTLKNSITLLFILLFVNAEIHAQDNRNLINSYLNTELAKNNWLQGDINDWVLSDQYTDKTTGLTHAYIQQRHHGIIVYNAITAFVIKENAVLFFNPGLIDHLENKVNADKPSVTPEKAIELALSHLKKNEFRTVKLLSSDPSSNKFIYDIPEISASPVKVQLVYRKAEERVLLAWDVSIEMKNEPHWWNVRMDARTGKFIDENDYTAEDNYNVFPFPLEAASFGSRSLLSNPADLSASPFGWHDVNGAAGAEYTITRGNNVYAYEDANNDNLPGYSPNGGAGLNFDFPIVANATPVTNQDASLTNLFYDNNAIHDFLYHLGFDEVAGNFQQNNYGRGGIGGDYVKAEGFDGSGTNNANFSTPPDGGSGRMQMYLWSGNGAGCSSLNISSSSFTGSMSIAVGEFSSVGTVTANLILAIDAVSPANDACSPITNNVSGKIVLIDRGLCNFIDKAQAAQAAGAVGVIIANNVSGTAPAMSGTPPVSIPCVSISQANGNTLKSALIAGTVSATITTCNANQLDGSFDNGVVAHEFGHGVSNRLTGGPSQASCLANGEQGGEGWSDWLALMMTIEPGDAGTDARGIGTYVKGQPTNGPGIRRYPYSTNMSINPQTYGSLAANPEVHAIGEIWCDVIWDMSWLLMDQYGFNSAFTPSSGNYIAMRLVLEGMKLQPCGPGFLDARDAILTADALIYNNAHRCLIWQAFARRGMGYNAVQGSADIAGDETQGFSLPPYCLPPTQAPVAAFTSDITTVSCGGTVHFTDQSVQAFNWSWNFSDQGTSNLQNPVHTFTAPGTYNVKLVVTNSLGSDSVTHAITVNPTFTANVTATPSSICSGDSVQLNAVGSGSAYRSYLVSNIGYSPLPDTGTAVSLGDDQVSSVRQIGFNFNFFGAAYSNFYICSNGFITFSANMPAPYYSSAIPLTVTPNNFIALAWNDLNPLNAGSYIKYYTIGSAPNRKLVVSYHTSHYGGTSFPFVIQAILYETTNVIEIHTTSITDVSAYDPEGRTTQGVENSDGSGGVAVPGRNNTIFSASNDAYRFTPYTPYTYNWIPGNLAGPTQTVHPPSTGTYAVQVSDGTACLATFNTPVITVNSCGALFNLKVFIEGLYLDNDVMESVLFNLGMNNDPTACDSITVEFHTTTQPYSTVTALKTLLHTNGMATVTAPGSLVNHSYYIAIRYRNAIETWSKNPILVTSPNFSFDLTRP